MTKTFTIAIPTRNREWLLKGTLESIFSQEEAELCEVIVCDNGTDQQSGKLCAKYKNYPNFRYYKNEEELSIDQNMLKVAELVTTEYFLWLGDDDCLVDGAINTVLNIIKSERPDFLLLTGTKTSEDCLTTFGSTLEKSMKNFYTDEDQVYTCPKDFFINHCFHMPFGTLIVNSVLMNNIKNQITRFMGTSHAYSGAVFDYLALKYRKTGAVKILLLREELVQLRQVEKTWKNDVNKIMFQEIPDWFILNKQNYSDEVKYILPYYLRQQFKFKTLLKRRFYNGISFSDYHHYTKYCHIRQKLKFLLVCLLPVFK